MSSTSAASSTATPTARRNIYFVHYPTSGRRRLAKLARSVAPHTIASNVNVFEDIFTTSSITCRYCDKPVVQLEGVDHCFSIIRPCFCAFGPDETTNDFKHNETVATILPPGFPTVSGPVLIFKHPACDDPSTPGGTLPLLDMNTLELELADEILSRWIQSLFEPQTLPPNTFVLPPPLLPSLLMSHISESSSSRELSRQLVVAQARILELESALASLTVDSPGAADSPARRHVRNTPSGITRAGPRLISLPSASSTVSISGSDSDTSDTSVFSIPDSDDEAPRPPSPPSSPPPRRAAERTSVPPAARREYLFSSPSVPPTRTTEWSQAAQNTQGVPNAQVRLVSQRPAPRKKAVCWAVFRGSSIGVFDRWDVAKAATTGFRLAIFQGYGDITAARRAYDYAVARGYTSTQSQDRGLALPLDLMPVSVVTANRVDEARLLPRTPDELWYIVYQGVNPGIYPTYLEAALNTNGIRLAAHDSRRTLPEAISAFQQAVRLGGVVVRRQPSRP
ncbi:hypothetical protein C8F01DRAFT_1252757 [Mycena amicta]|nr:hypothetical protein C8F01DRAFT_1252757 [Mycena amicta]